MARAPRFDGPGLTHHVIHRGNNRQRIFADAGEYARYVHLLEEGVARFGHDVLAFCLMPNHVHLVIRTQDVPLSDVIQNVAFRFAGWANRRHGRVGHVFQGRFHSFVAARDGHLLALIRYIHQNPVRAGMVDAPEQHAWNSHREYLGRGRFPWVNTEPVLSLLHPDVVAARTAYRELCATDAEEPSPPEETASIPRPSGPSMRRPRLRRDIPLDRIVAVVAEEFHLEPAHVTARSDSRFSPPSLVVAMLLREAGDLTLSRWAERLGRDAASLSRSLRRLERRAAKDGSLGESVKRIRRRLGLPDGPRAFVETG